MKKFWLLFFLVWLTPVMAQQPLTPKEIEALQKGQWPAGTKPKTTANPSNQPATKATQCVATCKKERTFCGEDNQSVARICQNACDRKYCSTCGSETGFNREWCEKKCAQCEVGCDDALETQSDKCRTAEDACNRKCLGRE